MRVYLISAGVKPIPAPSSLTATAVSANRINLAWVDNSLNEDGFKIERSLDGVNFTEITTVGAGVTTYASTGLSASTQYYYRVRAYKGALNSEYSNIANATTQAAGVERIITIDTTKTVAGGSASNQFTLSVSSPTNITVDWGDGVVQSGITTSTTKTYAVAGLYDVKITGAIRHSPNALASDDKQKYIEIKQWGTGVTGSNFSGAFQGCVNMTVTAGDAPSLSSTARTDNMFRNCALLSNPDFSNWNTSTVTNMSGMFENCHNFNGNITTWNVGSVTNFSSMFKGLNASTKTIFNQNIGSWNTSSATNMSSMFANSTFNQPIGSWNVSNVTNMTSIFEENNAFNQDLSSWNVGKVTSFLYTFFNADGMQSNGSIASWNIGANLTGTSVVNVSGFLDSVNYTPSLTSWNAIRIGDLTYTLRAGRSDFNYGVWDIRNCTSLFFFMGNATTSTLSAINLANMYIGWASIPVRNISASFGSAKYDASGASARAILTAARAVSVSGAINANANGSYPWNGTRYQNANGWYFTNVSSQWRLNDSANVTQATSTGTFPTQNTVQPATATGWTGTESGIVVTMTGAGWTITDGGQL